MADELHDIVTRMVAAGEPEENIAAVIQHYQQAATTSPVRDTRTPFQQATSQLKDVGIGVAKGAGSSLAGLAELATNAGLIPGVPSSAFNSDMRPPIFQRAQQLTTATNTPQLIGKGAEMAAELAPAAIGLAREVPAAMRAASGPTMEIASHLPVIGKYVRAARIIGALAPDAPDAAKVVRAPMGVARPPEFFTGETSAPTSVPRAPMGEARPPEFFQGPPKATAAPQATSSIRPTENAFVNVDAPQPLPSDNPSGYHTGTTGKGTGERMQSAHKIIKGEDANYQGAVADLKATVGPDFLKALLDSLNRGGR
jgi:hypothetical protein